jgi:hypothetical protein
MDIVDNTNRQNFVSYLILKSESPFVDENDYYMISISYKGKVF